MSAAANAAGYLYSHGLLPLTEVQAQGDTDGAPRSAVAVSPLPVKQSRVPRIEYRKRRVYVMPAAA
jgi:hypothetical protein